jgi:hypothetical protein
MCEDWLPSGRLREYGEPRYSGGVPAEARLLGMWCVTGSDPFLGLRTIGSVVKGANHADPLRNQSHSSRETSKGCLRANWLCAKGLHKHW